MITGWRSFLVFAGLGFAGLASAAPVTERWSGEADKRGGVNYSIRCDNGQSTIAQCLRDDRHCGYDRDEPLAEVAQKACDRLLERQTAPVDTPPQ